MKQERRGVAAVVLYFTLLALLTYAVIRSVLLAYSGYDPLEKTLAVLLMSGEFFILVHAAGYVLDILKTVSGKDREKPRFLSDHRPQVAVLVPARNEPKEVLENTFISINNIKYPHKRVYLLDDSTEERYAKEAEELSRTYALTLFRRTRPWHGAKAGIINDCLATISEEYLAIFDADQNPLPEFLNVTVPLLEQDQQRAFVQTPQFYSNVDNPIARAATLQQAVFYEYICEGKSLSDAMFCCGTNVVFRASVLKEIGGFDESTVTEDFATSIKIHTRRWTSLYYPHVYAFGMGPEDLGAYFKQQFRWAAGTMTVFKKALGQLLTRPFSLKPRQWLEYFLSSTYYFIGIAFWILMLCPIVYLLFDIPSFFARPEIYIGAFLPYMALSLSVFYNVLKKRNYRPKDLWLGQLLGIVSFSVYIRAAISALLGIKVSFVTTAKKKGASMPYRRLWPQVGMIILNFIAFVWGMNRFVYERNPAILVNSFWAFYHMTVLSSIFYFNRENT